MKRRLLFVAPVLPSDTGFGLAMRAGVFLDALAAIFDVDVLVVPVVEDIPAATSWRFTEERAERVVVLELRRSDLGDVITRLADATQRARTSAVYPLPALMRDLAPSVVSEATAVFGGQRYAAVHVMRLYLTPFAEPWLGRTICVLDLDDDEVVTRSGLSALHAERGRYADARIEADEAAAYRRVEALVLQGFDAITVCSQIDAEAVESRCESRRVRVVPNAIREPNVVGPSPERDVLFIGNMTFPPNADGARFLCRDVLPRLNALLGRQAAVTIVGNNGPEVRRLAGVSGVQVTGFVREVASTYACHRIAALPLRAGGGTSIKAIEAFARQRPVVSTSVGVRGLDVHHREHALVADDPVAFAEACAELIDHPAGAARMAQRAHDLFTARYSANVVQWRITELYDRLSARTAV